MEMKLGNVLHKLMVTIIVFSCIFIAIRAQEQQQQCANELRFCISYLNNTSQPPDTCCQPLDYIVKTLPRCFCNLVSMLTVNLVEAAGINISRAQTLPERCGHRINPLECITGTSVTRSNNPAPNSSKSNLWNPSFVVTMAVFSLIIIFQAL